jgi:sugar lactone lactonase YvrE
VALDGTHLYWSEYDGGAVWRADLDGGNPFEISANEVHAGCLAIDGSHLYWVAAGDGDAAVSGSVRRWPLDGGAVETFVQLGAELGIAVDDTSVYFSNTGGSQIYRIAK